MHWKKITGNGTILDRGERDLKRIFNRKTLLKIESYHKMDSTI